MRTNVNVENDTTPSWDQSAPLAQHLGQILYSWGNAHFVLAMCLLAVTPILVVTGLSPALLSLNPTAEMIAPIGTARSLFAGTSALQSEAQPLMLLFIHLADQFADAPGRIYLLAKVICGSVVVVPLSFFVSTRFPALLAVILCTLTALYITAPFSGSAELSLAMFMTVALAFLAPPAQISILRVQIEGVLSGALLFLLWMQSPEFSLIGFVALSACPILAGKTGVVRYGFSAAAFLMLIGVAEILAPGINFSRLEIATSMFDGAGLFGMSFAITHLAGIASSTLVVLFLAAVFGGGQNFKGWVAASLFLGISLLAAFSTGANAAPLFVMACAIACFSTLSPFYDGVFLRPDRASVAVAGSAAMMTLLWGTILSVQLAGQFVLQQKILETAPENILTELALVQPESPTVAVWVEEGRFSTPEARMLLSLGPADQSVLILEAATTARELTAEGHKVAILTAADAVCVLVSTANCQSDGARAAGNANIVLVPRLDLDPATKIVKGNAEALLITKFKLSEQTEFWETWVRRDALLQGTGSI